MEKEKALSVKQIVYLDGKGGSGSARAAVQRTLDSALLKTWAMLSLEVGEELAARQLFVWAVAASEDAVDDGRVCYVPPPWLMEVFRRHYRPLAELPAAPLPAARTHERKWMSARRFERVLKDEAAR